MNYRVFLGVGSNMGVREKYLQSAVQELGALKETRIVWTSSIYECEPYGNPDQPSFLNAVVEMETTLAPSALHTESRAIEQRLGRTMSERWGPREIDIDILIYDGLVVDEASLKVPHPEIEKRKFVLVPLREVAPDLVHPVSGLTMEELARTCRDPLRVVKSSHRIKL